MSPIDEETPARISPTSEYALALFQELADDLISHSDLFDVFKFYPFIDTTGLQGNQAPEKDVNFILTKRIKLILSLDHDGERKGSYVRWLERKRCYYLYRKIFNTFPLGSPFRVELRNSILKVWNPYDTLNINTACVNDMFFEQVAYESVDKIYQHLKGRERGTSAPLEPLRSGTLQPTSATVPSGPPLQPASDPLPSGPIQTTQTPEKIKVVVKEEITQTALDEENRLCALKLFYDLKHNFYFSELQYVFQKCFKPLNLPHDERITGLFAHMISCIDHREIKGSQLTSFIIWLKKKRNYYLYEEMSQNGTNTQLREGLLKAFGYNEWNDFLIQCDEVDQVYQYLKERGTGAPLEPLQSSTPLSAGPLQSSTTLPSEPQQHNKTTETLNTSNMTTSSISEESIYDKAISTLCKHHVEQLEKQIMEQMIEKKTTEFFYPLQPSIICDYVINHVETSSRGQFKCTSLKNGFLHTLHISVSGPQARGL